MPHFFGASLDVLRALAIENPAGWSQFGHRGKNRKKTRKNLKTPSFQDDCRLRVGGGCRFVSGYLAVFTTMLYGACVVVLASYFTHSE